MSGSEMATEVTVGCLLHRMPHVFYITASVESVLAATAPVEVNIS